jgi:hypothetical protein
MQKRIFAILLVAAVVAMASPASQAKCLYLNWGRAVGDTNSYRYATPSAPVAPFGGVYGGLEINGAGKPGTHAYQNLNNWTGKEMVNGAVLGSATNEIKFEVDFKYPTALGSTYCGLRGTTMMFSGRSDGVMIHEGLGASATIPSFNNTAITVFSTTGTNLGAWAGLNTATIYVDGAQRNSNLPSENLGNVTPRPGDLTYTALTAYIVMDQRPYYTTADVAAGVDPNGQQVPPSTVASQLPLRLQIVRPLADGSAMTSRTLGPDVSAHNNYTNNAVNVPYDHAWHTMRVQIALTDMGGGVTSPVASLAIDGVVKQSATLTGVEYMALNSFYEMEQALGTANSTAYRNQWCTGRNFLLVSGDTCGSTANANGGGPFDVDEDGCLRWDNAVINDKPLEQFNATILTYRYDKSFASNLITRPTGIAPCLQRAWGSATNNTGVMQDVTDNSKFEKTLGARDWTIY